MPILAAQQRARELGRIRMGQKGNRGAPQKLDRFRITSASEPIVRAIASLYGGTPQPWDNNGLTHHQVIINEQRIPILLPPQPVTQWLETWTGAGCVHRCDGVTNVLTDQPCDEDDPDHVNAKPTTRLNVVLRDLDKIGVFRLESHGWNAAVELPFLAEFLSRAGAYVQAHLGMEERIIKKIMNGKPATNRFMVPVIDTDGLTPAQIMAGAPATGVAVGAGSTRLAIEAAPPRNEGDLYAEIEGAPTLEVLRAIYTRVRANPPVGLDPVVFNEWIDHRRVELEDEDVERAERESNHTPGDVDTEYQACVMIAGKIPLTLTEMGDEFAAMNDGLMIGDATVDQLIAFRTYLEGAANG